MSDKQLCRREARDIMLDDAYRLFADGAIIELLLPLLSGAKCVMCYASGEREPSTLSLIENLLKKGVRVALPRCDREQKGVMSAREIKSLCELSPGAYGIPEPPETSPVMLKEEMDVVIMPCVATDRHGVRLGHGAGYYDRFLGDIDRRTICLCYERFVFESLPHDAHDCIPDCIITEKEVRWATDIANLR